MITAPNGDIFVADGHSGLRADAAPDNITPDREALEGRQVHQSVGQARHGPGEFHSPHALAMDSQGRLFVADRGNSRIQIFDQDGKITPQWPQFGRPSGLYIDAKDNALRNRRGLQPDDERRGLDEGRLDR